MSSVQDSKKGFALSRKTIESSSVSDSFRGVRIPFNQLFERLGKTLVDDRAVLLFYILIHGNR